MQRIQSSSIDLLRGTLSNMPNRLCGPDDAALNDAGFSDITMYETLVRSQDVTPVFALQSVDVVADKLKRAEEIKEMKRLRQIAAGQRSHENFHGEKRKRGGQLDGREELPPDTDAEDTGSGKRLKPDDEMDDATVPQETGVSRSLDEPSMHIVRADPAPPAKTSVSKAMPEVRGHTSYLTFASLHAMPPAAASHMDASSQGFLSF
ncbi:hypothetical protein C8R43DRAFT_1125984 [Mycena crocata]|nr:hypothetical protein C8R43DRAFT_1125984 [Mycena crocata]